jgi:amino acid transporter
VGIVVAVIIPCVHAFVIQGNIERILPLVLAAVCAWGIAYLLVTCSVVLLRIRRPDLPRAYKSPWFPLPQIISSVGIVLAIIYITPRHERQRYLYSLWHDDWLDRAICAVLDRLCAKSKPVQAGAGRAGAGGRVCEE